MKPIEVVTGNCHFQIKRVISSTDVIQLTLTLKMTTAQVVETSTTTVLFRTTFTDDHTRPTYETNDSWVQTFYGFTFTWTIE